MPGRRLVEVVREGGLETLQVVFVSEVEVGREWQKQALREQKKALWEQKQALREQKQALREQKQELCWGWAKWTPLADQPHRHPHYEPDLHGTSHERDEAFQTQNILDTTHLLSFNSDFESLARWVDAKP